MKKIIIYDRIAQDHVPRWLNGLLIYLRNKGFKVIEKSGKFNYDKELKDCCAVFLWNGQQAIHEPIKRKCSELNIPYWFIECGFFPQSEYYYIDSNGINANSSIMDDDFSDITIEDIENLNKFKIKYLKNRKYSGKDQYILVPLQLEQDTNIIDHSPFQKMEAFINYVENEYKYETVLFKTHPVMPYVNYKTRYPLIRQGSFLDLAQDAKLIVGINSTCLLESLLMGVPTIALGNGFVQKHQNNLEKMLAKLVKIQIPVGKTDLDQWLESILTTIKEKLDEN